MAAKNDIFMEKYKSYTRLIGNVSEESEESDENSVDGGQNQITYKLYSFEY